MLTYQNITLVGPQRRDVAESLTRSHVKSFVAPTLSGATVVFDERGDFSAEPTETGRLAVALSESFSCFALAAGVFDESLFLLGLYRDGELVFEYNSAVRSLDDIQTFEKAVGRDKPFRRLRFALRLPHGLPYLLESWRHARVTGLLKLPSAAVGLGYRLICQGRLPRGLQITDLVYTE